MLRSALGMRVAAETKLQMPSKSTSMASQAQSLRAPATSPDGAAQRLARSLRPIAADRAASAEQLVLESAVLLHAWVLAQPASWSWRDAGRDLETGWAYWLGEQGWRGPVALFVDTLRHAWHFGAGLGEAGGPAGSARELLSEELGLWTWGRETGTEALTGSDEPWDGRPFSPGRRLADRQQLAERVPEIIERGEVVLVPAYSETVILALAAAQRAGRAPEAIVPEGAPGLDGRRAVRRLVELGVKARFVYDAALLAALPRADRVCLGAEAIGGQGFLGRVGTRHLLEEAERREVPSLVLATSDKLVPGGALELPAWGERETWILWESAPNGVRLEPQPYEPVPHDLASGFWTEAGPESAAQLSLRRLRVEPARPCAEWPGATEHGATLDATSDDEA